MRFTKFGKALSMGVLSAGVIFGVTSCVESYTVGFLYVTGNVTASSGSSGIISGYKIDHNTGKLTTINGLPISTGGANPVRAVLTVGSRFLYVLNRGVNNAGNGNCYGTGSAECQNGNITEFAVGGNGILTPQETFYTQGLNPFRLLVDSSGSYLMVLDHDAPDNASPSSNDNCARALGAGITDLRRHYGLPDQCDHGPLVPGRECAGHIGKRSPAHLLPGSRQSCRSRSQRRIRPHPHRCAGAHILPVHRRHRRLAILLCLQQRPVDAQPEQCAAARHPLRATPL